MTRVPVARVADLWAGEMAAADAGHLPVVLVNVAGTIHAYEDRCPHRGVPLSDGRFDGEAIICTAHEWTYDARTGQGLNPRVACLRPLAVLIEGEEVCVEIGRDDGDRAGAAEMRVGPVLQSGTHAEAVIAAICRLNRDVEIVDRGAYLRVMVPRACRVTRAAIEAELRAPFTLPGDLERMMTSFTGRLRLTEDEARWEAP